MSETPGGSFKKEIWSACSHTCKPKHASSLTAVRTRRVTCVDDKKRIVQEQLCEQTAEKPVDTEVKIYLKNGELSKKMYLIWTILYGFYEGLSMTPLALDDLE